MKDALRNIWKQKVSYLSIIVIAFLGVTTFLGIDYSDGALKKNGSRMYNGVNFRDIEIISTMLLTTEDLEKISATEGVADTEAVWQTEAKLSSDGKKVDAQVISLTERMNQPDLVEGRLPETVHECAVEQGIAEELGWQTGDEIDVLDAKGETAKYLLDSHYVITGIANHPDHTSVSIPDTLYVMVIKDAFDQEALDNCFMKAEVVIGKPDDMDRFGKKYDEAVAEVMARLDVLAEERSEYRDRSVREKGQSEIDEGQAALDNGEEELSKARAELDDGWDALSKGEKELAEGETMLFNASQLLTEGWQKLLDGKLQLETAEAELAKAEAELDTGAEQLEEGRQRLEDARAQLIDGWNALEDAKSEVRNGIRYWIEENSGVDTSGLIPWAPRMNVDLSGGTSASELWITTGFQLDLSQSIAGNISDFFVSGEVPDELLILIYKNLQGGIE